MNTTRSDEPQLKDALDHLVMSLEIPHRLTTDAMVQGRRLRVRRRTSVAVGALASAALVGVVAPALSGALPGSDGGSPGIAAASTRVVSDPRPEGWWDITARQMERKLQPLLPDGSRTSDVEYRMTDQAPGELPGPQRGYLSMNLDTGSGYGGFNLVFYPEGTYDDPTDTESATPLLRFVCPPEEAATILDCEPIRDEVGRERGRIIRQVVGGVTTYEAVYLRSDGVIVYAAAGNSTRYKWQGPATSEEPALNGQQLLRIAESPVWAR